MTVEELKKSYIRRMLIVCVIGMIGMFAITWSFVQHAFTQQMMVRLLLVLVVSMWIALFAVILNHQKAIRRLKESPGYVDPELTEAERIRIQAMVINKIFWLRINSVWFVIVAIAIIYQSFRGILGIPVYSLLIIILIGLFFLYARVQEIRVLKKKLDQGITPQTPAPIE